MVYYQYKTTHTSVMGTKNMRASLKAHFYMEGFAKGCILKQRLTNLAT